MFARSTTFHGRPDRVDAGIKFVKDEVAPLLTSLEGCQGLSLLVNRETGQTIATSSWSTNDAMMESDAQLRPLRDRGKDLLGGSMQIDEWEISLMHRNQHGGACRVGWAKGDLDQIESVFRWGALPNIEATPGFCSASLLLNRSTGISCVTTCWETAADLDSSREMADSVRARAMSDSNSQILDVIEFELAYAHLHVPELV